MKVTLLLAVLLFIPKSAHADLTLDAPSSITIARGTSGTFVASVTSTRRNKVTLNLPGTLPKGISFTRKPAECVPSCTSTFTVNASKTAIQGSHALNLRATDNNFTAWKTITVTIPGSTPPPPPPPPDASERQGFGAHTLGGEDQPMYRVTNLANSGVGSLRDALSQGNRYIVFDVAGDIRLSSSLAVRGANVTIDGCSAPAPGITLLGFDLSIRGNLGAHDIIVQCLRVRQHVADGISISEGAYNIVIDRTSVHGDAGDGSIDITSWNGQATRDVTIQRTIISKPFKAMLIKYVPTARITLHHNLFEGSSDRSPRIGYHDQTGVSMPPASEIVADMRNNVIANWKGGQGTNVECGAKANIVGNYYTNPGYPVNDQEQAIRLWADNNPFPNCPRGWAFIQGNVSADVPDIDNSPGILSAQRNRTFSGRANRRAGCL